MRLRSLGTALLAPAVLAVLAAGPAAAAAPRMPGQKDVPYQRWSYPAQIPTGPIEDGTSPARPASGGFLTLPFAGPHYVTSIFDHSRPDYTHDGRVCRYDGVCRAAGGFDEDGPPTQDWLYYDGHDGLDYGLYYENVVAAADGVVSFADWDKPGCVNCGFGQNIRVDHGNGITTRYAHLATMLVAKGERVRRGQVIGVSGNTGASTGEHLHFGVYLTEGFVAIDPYGWSGSFPDPWPRDVGNLWLGGAPRFAGNLVPAVSVALAADAVMADDATVTWSGTTSGAFDVAVVDGDGAARPWLSGVPAGSRRFTGEPGHSYRFLATLHDDLGWSATASSTAFMPGVRGLLG